MQFPWIALANTDLAVKMFGKGLIKKSETADGVDMASTGSNKTEKERLGMSNGIPDPTATFRRLWNVRKMDPSTASAAALETVQFHTMVKASISHISPYAEHADRLIKSAYQDKAELSVRLASRKFDPLPKPR